MSLHPFDVDVGNTERGVNQYLEQLVFLNLYFNQIMYSIYIQSTMKTIQ
jgi:hypothetical protein